MTSQTEVIGHLGHCQLSGWVTENVCLCIFLSWGNSLPSSQTAGTLKYAHATLLKVSIYLPPNVSKRILKIQLLIFLQSSYLNSLHLKKNKKQILCICKIALATCPLSKLHTFISPFWYLNHALLLKMELCNLTYMRHSKSHSIWSLPSFLIISQIQKIISLMKKIENDFAISKWLYTMFACSCFNKKWLPRKGGLYSEALFLDCWFSVFNANKIK